MTSVTTNLCLLALRPIRTQVERTLPRGVAAGRETEVAFANRVAAAVTVLSQDLAAPKAEREAYRSAAKHVDEALECAKVMVVFHQKQGDVNARQPWDTYVATLRDVHRRLTS